MQHQTGTLVKTMEESRGMTTPLPHLGSLADLHVYLVPKDCWLPYQKIVRNQVIDESISYGFIRVQSQVTLNDLRKDLEEQLENEDLPRDYNFLRCVGRNFAQVKPKQEMQLKVRDFMPPFAPEPEIYLLESPREWPEIGKNGVHYGVRDEAGVVARRGSGRSRHQRRSRNTRARGPNHGVQFPALDTPPTMQALAPPAVSSQSHPFPQLPPVPAKGRSETTAPSLAPTNGNIVSLRTGAGRADQQLKFPRIELEAYEDDSGDHREIRFYNDNARVRGGADKQTKVPGGGVVVAALDNDSKSAEIYPAPSSLAGKPVLSSSVSRSLYRPKRVSIMANVLKNKHPNRSGTLRPNSHAVHHYHHYIVVPSVQDQDSENGTRSTTIRLEAVPSRGQTRRHRPAHASLYSNGGHMAARRRRQKKNDSGSEASKSSSENSIPVIPKLNLPSTTPLMTESDTTRMTRRRTRHAKSYGHDSADDQLEALIRDYANFTPSTTSTTVATTTAAAVKPEVEAIPIAVEPPPHSKTVPKTQDASRRRNRHAHCFPSELEGPVMAPSTVTRMALKTVQPVLPDQEPISPRRVLMPSGIEVLSLSEAKRIRHANCLTNETVPRKIMSRSGVSKTPKASVIRPILKPPSKSTFGSHLSPNSGTTGKTLTHTRVAPVEPQNETTLSSPPFLTVPTLKQKRVKFPEKESSAKVSAIPRKPKVFIQGQHGTLQEITNRSLGVRDNPSSPTSARRQQHVVTFADTPTYSGESPVKTEESDVAGNPSSGEVESKTKEESSSQPSPPTSTAKGPSPPTTRRKKDRGKRSTRRRPTSIQVTVDLETLSGQDETVSTVSDSNGGQEAETGKREKKPTKTPSPRAKQQPVSWVIDHVHIEEFPGQVPPETLETSQTSTAAERHIMSPLQPRRKLLPPPRDSPTAADVSESESTPTTSPPYPEPQRTILLCSIDRR